MPDKEKTLLKPTVKRDLSLWSVEAWQKGYLIYLEEKLGFRYDIVFHYDATKVHFYHKAEDFKYFKEVITPRIIEDDSLFKRLNDAFLDDITKLRAITEINATNLSSVFECIARTMAFYIFVVSDAFVKARPEAAESRHLSEGILYELDTKVETYFATFTQYSTYAHVMRHQEALQLMRGEAINSAVLQERRKGYVLYGDDCTSEINFSTFCEKYNLTNPEVDGVPSDAKEIRGDVASGGVACGRVCLVANREDFAKLRHGDVVITVMTNANYVPILKMAAACVTDEGGALSHAAITSRELNIPCVVGTKVATRVFKDGDMVEVDARQGIVRKIV